MGLRRPGQWWANTSDLVNPNHTYANAGAYAVEMTVTDNFGNTDQASVEITVTAPNLPPAVSPTATPASGPAPLSVQFNANGSDPNPGDVLSYSWDFGDSSPASTDANPLHVYVSPGTYTATVSVSDGTNPAVSADLVISVGSALSINVKQFKVDYGKKGKLKGKVTMISTFTFPPGPPAPGDVIMVSFDGITLVEVPFSEFKQKKPDEYKYKGKDKKEKVRVNIDFNHGVLVITRHKMELSEIDDDHGIDVVIAFGAHTAIDNVKPKVKIKHHNNEDDD